MEVFRHRDFFSSGKKVNEDNSVINMKKDILKRKKEA